MRGPFLVLLGALCFSTTGFFQAIAPVGASGYVLAGARMLLGSFALFVYSRMLGRRFSWGGWPWKYVLIYVFCMGFFQVAFFQALPLVGVAVGTVVAVGSTPIFSGLIAWLIDRTPPKTSWFVATAIAISGLVIMNATESLSFDLVGIVLALTAGASYAGNLAVARFLTQRHSPEEAAMLASGMVGVALLPAFAFYPVDWIFTFEGLRVIAGLGIMTAACGFSLTMAGLKTTPAPIASTLALAEPLGAALLGILVLHEPSSPQTLIGIGCLFAAVLILIVTEAKKQKSH